MNYPFIVMQTLQIDYENTFEALPGLYVLLHNDSPRFTVGAITSEYAANCCLPREALKGMSIFEVELDTDLKWDHSLLESLQIVSSTGRAHTFNHSALSGQSPIVYQVSNHPVHSKSGDVQ